MGEQCSSCNWLQNENGEIKNPVHTRLKAPQDKPVNKGSVHQAPEIKKEVAVISKLCRRTRTRTKSRKRRRRRRRRRT